LKQRHRSAIWPFHGGGDTGGGHGGYPPAFDLAPQRRRARPTGGQLGIL